MVIPIGGIGQQISGPIPAECTQAAQRVKFTVFASVVCLIGRILCATFQGILAHEFLNGGLLNSCFVIVTGIFILKDDVQVQPYYNGLATSICQQCHEQGMGGLGCLMPFTICNLIGFIFDLILRNASINKLPYGMFMAGSILAEAASAYFGYSMYKLVRDNGLGMSPDMEMNSGGLSGMQGGFLSGGGSGYARDLQPGQGQAEAPSGGDSSGGGFVAFAGSGQRLGS
mmetsp:Transcript_20644/g.33310  ORF Transcript_20644/g.33310 Transcript_20644/m.33310 type:complete len:228 (+) Transcript_20644:70-753(+)